MIFTTEERARDLAQQPVFVESAALSSISELNFELLVDMGQDGPPSLRELLWSRTGLGPADVDCAQLYDGFTFITFQWLEALGLCGEGEAGPFSARQHPSRRLDADEHRWRGVQRRPSSRRQLLH